MRRIRFHQEVYSAGAVEAAAKVFADHGLFELTRGTPYHELAVTAKAGTDEDLLADELATYALALSVEEKRS